MNSGERSHLKHALGLGHNAIDCLMYDITLMDRPSVVLNSIYGLSNCASLKENKEFSECAIV